MSSPDMLADLVSDLRYRFRAIFRRAVVERELDDEMSYHLARETEKNMQRGLHLEEAARRARIDFGGVDRFKEDSRDGRGVQVLETILRDLRYAARGLSTHPGFTLAVIATLALGIGANTAMFGVVDRLMFRPLAYLRDPASVNRVYLEYSFRGETITNATMQYPRFIDLTKGASSISQSAAFHYSDLAIGSGDVAQEMHVAAVSASFFEFFDTRPVLGRFFDASEDIPPIGTPTIVLGNALWRTRFGARRDVIGQKVQVGSLLAVIVGVAPEGFVGADPTEPAAAFIPITAYASFVEPDYDKKYNWEWLRMIVRRKPGVGSAQAATELTRAYGRSWEVERASRSSLEAVAKAQPRVIVAPLQQSRGPNPGRDAPVVIWICGMAAIVLGIACANVANLLLARAYGRRREIAVRLALGVSRRRLIGQLITESLLLAILAGAAGLLIGEVGQTLLRTMILPKTPTIGVLDDPRTLVFASLLVLATGLVTGVVPAIQSGRSDLTTALKSGVRAGTHQRSQTRNVLLLAQGALSVFLLVGAGLFVRSLSNVTSTRLGYDVDPVLYVFPNLRGSNLTKEQDFRLSTKLANEARDIPGVEHVAQAITVPLYTVESESFSVPGIDSASKLGDFQLQMGSADYFRTMGTRILRGRGIDSSDHFGAPLVAVVSDGMARRLWPNQSALGKCIKMDNDTMPCTTVIGVAENAKIGDVVGDQSLQYYLAIDQIKPAHASLFIRARDNSTNVAEVVRKRLQPLMPGASYVTVTPMRQIVDPSMSSWRMGATMFLLFGILALTLAAIGLYSVIAYNVAQRTHELGLRIALGAHVRDVLRMILAEGLRFGLAGIAIGVVIALAAGHWVQPLLYEESARDPLVFVAVAMVLVIAAIAASALPALRAVRVEPSITLRTE